VRPGNNQTIDAHAVRPQRAMSTPCFLRGFVQPEGSIEPPVRLRAFLGNIFIPGVGKSLRASLLAVTGSQRLEHSVEEYLAWCFEQRTPPRVSELATRLGVSRYTLAKNFTAARGITRSAYLKQRQLARAKELLTSACLSIAEVATRAGFGSERALRQAFRGRIGLPPSAFRNK
jgi:AraC-like DNA-binding protein